jgi:CheY-like chemotaxis protein
LSVGAGPPRAAPAHPTASLRDAVVVVGDDDEATRLILGKFLNGAGTVYFATNGDEVIQMTAAHDPAIVVLDAEMPGRDGWATARALRSMPRAGLRFVAGLTAHVEPETHRSLIEAGCDVVLEKPVSRERLLDALAKGRGRAGEARPGTAGAPGGVAASRSPDTAFAGTMVVEKDLLPLMPGFLASRRALARDLNDALGRADRAEALRLAHKLRGGFDMCGLVEIGQAFRDIEDQLRCDQDVRAVAARALALAASLETLRIEARSEHEGSES